MTLPTSTPNWFDSSEAGAPTLNNAAGSMLAVLRACLIDGFGSKSVTNIVVSSEVATVNCTAHGFSGAYGKLVLIEGSGESSLNGRKRIGNVLTDSFTYPAPGVANGTYTGTITAKRAPLGWSEPHSGTNVAMFARTAPEATAMLLRVNDTASQNARVVMVESATDIETFVDQSPTNAQLSGGQFWFKGADSATAKPWAIFGNDLLFYVVLPNINGTITTYTYGVHGFGDLAPVFTPDPYCCFLAGATSSVTSGTQNNRLTIAGSVVASISTPHTVLARGGASFATKSVRCQTVAHSQEGSPLGSESTGPTRIDEFILAAPVMLVEDSNGPVRGVLPGFANPLCRVPFSALPQFSVIDSIAGTDRRFVSVLNRAQGANGNLLIDVSGPWR